MIFFAGDLVFVKRLTLFILETINSASWVIFHAFVTSAVFFSKSTFLKNSLRNTTRVTNSLDPDQAWHLVDLIWVQTVCTGHQQTTLWDKELISFLPKNHADGDKWLVTEINFTSILSDLLKNFHKTKHSLFLWQWLPWKLDIKISWRLAERCPRKNVKLILFRLVWNLFWLHLLLALFRDHNSCIQNFSEKRNMPSVLCCLATNNVSPWKPIFRTLKIDHFQI